MRPYSTLSLFAAMLLGGVAVAQDVIAPGPITLGYSRPTASANGYIVVFAPGTTQNERADAATFAGARLRHNYDGIDAAAVTVPNANALDVLRRNPRVVRVVPDFIVRGGVKGGGHGGPPPPPTPVVFDTRQLISAVSFVDPLGLSSLLYDNQSHTLTVYTGAGDVAGTFPAYNNAQISSRGPWAAGTYRYDYHTPHAGAGPDSPYGSNGNFVFKVPGCVGCGVHSGRTNSRDRAGCQGPAFATNGCIRTTDAGTSLINQLNSGGDPLTTLKVMR